MSGSSHYEKVMKRNYHVDISNRKTNTDNWMLSRVRMESRSMKEEKPALSAGFYFGEL